MAKVIVRKGFPMKKLIDIIEAVKNNEKPDYDELRYAVLALSALNTFDSMAIGKLAEGEREKKKPFLTYSAEWQLKELFRRNKAAFGKSPKEWLGWNNDPENPEYQKCRKISIKIFDKFLKD
jgi:hypothetical protein